MLKVSDQRQFCWSVRAKRSESAPLQQLENEGKQYRTLLAIFTLNINATVKNHRNCLADADSTLQFRASRQETQMVMDQLERVYIKMEQKLMRDALNRNVFAKKSIGQFAQIYRNAFPEWDWHRNGDMSQNVAESHDQLGKEFFSQRRQSTGNSTPRRPQSSKQGRNTRISLIHQAYSSTPYKIKTVMAHALDNPQGKNQKDTPSMTQRKLKNTPSRIKKMQMNGRNRYEDFQYGKQKEYEELLFNGEEIMINERRFRQSAQQFQTQLQTMGTVRRQSTKRMLNLKSSHRKSIIQVEKMQIQSRISMIGSALSVNLVQPQGYRPKSRCWQNYFN